MAKIIIEFDTVDKSATVTVDGTAVSDVVEASLVKRYSYSDGGEDDGDDFYCSVSTATEDEANKTRTTTRLVAADSREGKAIAAVVDRPASPLPGFEVAGCEVDSQVARDINDFFNSLRR